jgi:prepilin signal peptidase PulO-like enzyme (type II secretory pathway)
MEVVTISSILAVLGLCMGSFAGATVWRLRARELANDESEYERLKAASSITTLKDDDAEAMKELIAQRSERVRELKQLRPIIKPVQQDHSQCLHCHHQLAWHDLLPLVSWLRAGGKCRYCHKTIGRFEPVMELGTAVVFVGSFVLWPVGLYSLSAGLVFGLWLIAAVMLVILFAYDFKWFLLPNVVMFPLIGVSLLIAIIHIAMSGDIIGNIASLGGAIIILSGLYWVLWKVSRGAWVGYGDIKLGLALALLLGNWQLAFVALFSANLVGCLLVLPGMAAGKITRMTRVPFGPLLITGGIIALLGGQTAIDWYMRTML